MNQHSTVYHAWQTTQAIFPTMSRPKTKQLARFAHELCLAQNCQLPQVAHALTECATAAAHERCCQRFLSEGSLDLPAAQQALTRWLVSVLPLSDCLTLRVDETALGNHLRV